MPTDNEDSAAKAAPKTPRKAAPRKTASKTTAAKATGAKSTTTKRAPAKKAASTAKASAAKKTTASSGTKRTPSSIIKGVDLKKTGEDLTTKGSNLANEAKEKASEFAKESQKRTGAAIANVAELISDSAGAIDDRLGERYGDVARSASKTVAGVATRVDEGDLSELADEAREFVRKSPGLAIGLAVTAGLVMARLMKSTRD